MARLGVALALALACAPSAARAEGEGGWFGVGLGLPDGAQLSVTGRFTSFLALEARAFSSLVYTGYDVGAEARVLGGPTQLWLGAHFGGHHVLELFHNSHTHVHAAGSVSILRPGTPQARYRLMLWWRDTGDNPNDTHERYVPSFTVTWLW